MILLPRVIGRTQTKGVGEQTLRIFGPKMEEITGGLRNLYNVELHNFNFSKDLYGQMQENEICGACTYS
jgi:hypothetical protein